MVLVYVQKIGMYFDTSHLVHISINTVISSGFNKQKCQQKTLLSLISISIIVFNNMYAFSLRNVTEMYLPLII